MYEYARPECKVKSLWVIDLDSFKKFQNHAELITVL